MDNLRGLWRGKRLDNKVWVEGYYLHLSENDLHIIVGLDGQYNRIEPETRGECESMTDKNGVKIFEGDIIKAIWQHLGSTDTVVGSVVFIDASFVLETKEHFLFFEDNIFAVDCEVIGNIHDNPELLEGDNDDESN